jgi:hypothetical protein
VASSESEVGGGDEAAVSAVPAAAPEVALPAGVAVLLPVATRPASGAGDWSGAEVAGWRSGVVSSWPLPSESAAEIRALSGVVAWPPVPVAVTSEMPDEPVSSAPVKASELIATRVVSSGSVGAATTGTDGAETTTVGSGAAAMAAGCAAVIGAEVATGADVAGA